MWPGVSNKDQLGDFKADDVVDIYDSNGKFIAVGAYGCKSSEL